MIDSNLRPYLIEINQMPSFETDSPLDARIKRGLLTDCLKTLGLTYEKKIAMKRDIQESIKQRLLKPQKTMMVDDPQDGKNAAERLEEQRKLAAA
jgi:hypothetical protein